ncbi:hypothetical protein I3843_02G046800 [Carya illinoinensis]|nr:hypothetical protein I3843_02G046800 [Carya illinoinensis]
MMEGIKGLGGKGRVGVGEEGIGDSMQCNDHAYRNNPGGICPFCLQEKLGKLASSSFPSPSFKSDIENGGAGSSSSSPSLSVQPTLTKVIYDGGSKDAHYHEYYRRRARILFLLGKKIIKKKKKVTTVASSDRAVNMAFKRSKYTATPGRKPLLGGDNGEHLVSIKRKSVQVPLWATASALSLECKVWRSRSVGCGSRSFSGDLFERISAGFGNCTLRRVESQKCMKERVKCGGIFAGFMRI